MLDPRQRTLLFEALRPPDGYALDEAVGTTYSLDLLALLAAPLAFTFFDWEDREGRPTTDPLVLLEALRRHARRITIFCQAGRIAIPPTHRPLLGYLEASVVEATAPHPQGAFHPKVWALRFTAEDAPVRYRVLCLSRNLTFDRSWDTALVLDGELTQRKMAIAANHPIGDFFQTLPGMAVRGVTEKVEDRLDRIQHEIRRVRFELPDGFEELGFWAFGQEGRNRWPFPELHRPLLVIAPFVSDSLLRRLAEEAKDKRTLVSRVEELDRIPPETLNLFTNVYTMATEADAEDVQEAAAEGDDRKDETLSGLHAKLYVMDDGWQGRVLTGSANATEAGFGRNVELLVELRGKKSQCGIDAMLGGSDGRAGFIDLLQPYSSPTQPPDEKQKRLEKLVEDARRSLARAGLRLAAVESDAAGVWDLEVAVPRDATLEVAGECTVRCWPVSLSEERAASFDPRQRPPAQFHGVSWQALTTFVAFSVEAAGDGEKQSARFVLNLPLDGGPEDRHGRLIEQVLRDRAEVLRFLLLLLADDIHVDPQPPPGPPGADVTGFRFDLATEMPLFESLVRALDRDPSRLDRVARLVEDLSKSESSRSLLPDGFEDLWRVVWQARQELGRD